MFVICAQPGTTSKRTHISEIFGPEVGQIGVGGWIDLGQRRRRSLVDLSKIYTARIEARMSVPAEASKFTVNRIATNPEGGVPSCAFGKRESDDLFDFGE